MKGRINSEIVEGVLVMLRRLIAPLFIAAVLALSACGRAGNSGQALDGRIQVVASTSIIGDIVGQIGGDNVSVTSLVPIGGDTHTFSPTPQDVARVTSARVVFVNGAGYEEFLATLLQSAGGSAEVVELSKGITLRELAEGESHEEGEAHEEGGLDPHVWTDPANVKYWTQTIAETLGRVDAEHAELYAENAARFNTELDELDAWIGAQFAEVPAEQRLLVTDHAVFGYMADRYGLEQIGTILPGYSSAAQPSAQELAALQDEIAEHGVKAIFVGDVVNENLAGQIADDTGVRLVTVLTESLTPTDGPAPTYIEYMRHNVTTMAEALR
jgi:zinc/manganese transport system substrate-binding protein/manganese/iron transport system substrate-binding protein